MQTTPQDLDQNFSISLVPLHNIWHQQQQDQGHKKKLQVKYYSSSISNLLQGFEI